MKKLLALAPFFLFAACGSIDLGEKASAQVGGTGGSGGSGTAGAGGSDNQCSCQEKSNDGERLKKQYAIGDDGSRADLGHFLDTKTDLICTFQSLPNGETRCVPEHVAMNTFIDKECKVPVYLVNYSANECVPKLPTFVRFDLRNGADCSANFNGFRIGSANTSEPQTIASWYTLDANGNCGGHGLPFDKINIAYSVSVLGDEAAFVKANSPTGF
jgi:hypothetical protein